MDKEKYVPARKCITCRNSFPKAELIRFSVSGEHIALDADQKAPGRGIYICNKQECINAAFDKNFFAKTLRRKVDKEELAKLRKELNDNNKNTREVF